MIIGRISKNPDMMKMCRIIRVILTREGRDFINESDKLVNEHLKELLSSLSLVEVEELNKSIMTIKNVVLGFRVI